MKDEIQLTYYSDPRIAPVITYSLGLISFPFYNLTFNRTEAENADYQFTEESDLENFNLCLDIQNTLENTQTGKHAINKILYSYDNSLFHLSLYAFCRINCLNELIAEPAQFDSFGRYKPDSLSIENEIILRTKNFFSKYPLKGKKSEVFVSHDIDSLFNARLQNLAASIKQKSLKQTFQVLTREFFGRHNTWNNTHKIAELNNSLGIKTTFFWLLKNGEIEGIKHADYSLTDAQAAIKFTHDLGHTNGLHKSSFKTTFMAEWAQVAGLEKINRFHFLNFRCHSAWTMLEDEGFWLDASLGFAGLPGFRNGYGMPFHPFDFRKNKPMNLIVTPLTNMDVTYFHYLKLTPEEIRGELFNFIDSNTECATLGLLWHNSMFGGAKYEGMQEVYIHTINKINQNNMNILDPSQIRASFAE